MIKTWMGVALLLALWQDAGAADATARVTELHGSVRRAQAPLRLLDTLQEGEQIELAPAAVLMVWQPASDRRYVLGGPGRFRMAADGPQLLPGSGKGSTRLLGAPSAPSGANLPHSVLAGAIMRAGDSVTEDEQAQHQPQFVWHSRPHRGAWRFRLYAADGALLHQAEVADNRYLLPPELVLTPGLRYRWELAWSDSQSDDKRETHSFRAVELTLAERAGRAGALRDAGSLPAAHALAPELFTPEVRP